MMSDNNRTGSNGGKELYGTNFLENDCDMENELWTALEDLVYEFSNKNTLNFMEYESKYNENLFAHLDIEGVLKCIKELNKTTWTSTDSI
jgi:hypothetical protein